MTDRVCRALRHLEGTRRIHICRDDRDRVILLARVQELEFAGDVDFTSTRERRALRTDKNILEIESNGVFDMHAYDLSKNGEDSAWAAALGESAQEVWIGFACAMHTQKRRASCTCMAEVRR